MDRTKFAVKATQVLGGGGRTTAAASAVVLLILVAVAGAALADHALRIQEDLLDSPLAVSITAAAETGGLGELLGDGESTVLLMKYINSMAGAVTNMEVSPKMQFSQFSAMLAAARDSDVTITNFACTVDGKMLSVFCTGENQEAGLLFLEKLDQAGVFSSVMLVPMDEKDQYKFTINGLFM